MDDSNEDQKLPHHREPKEFIPLDKLSELGVLSWRLSRGDNYETDENLKKIREARGYSYVVHSWKSRKALSKFSGSPTKVLGSDLYIKLAGSELDDGASPSKLSSRLREPKNASKDPSGLILFPLVIHSFDLVVSSVGTLSIRGTREAGARVTVEDPMAVLQKGCSVTVVLAVITFGMPESVREITDVLDVVGNTTKATTKGFAIGSAALASFLLFGDYIDQVASFAHIPFKEVDIAILEVFVGGLLGSMLIFLFSGWACSAVGRTAQEVVNEVRRQFIERPGIMDYKEIPDYGRCVSIVASASLWEMIKPGALAIISPLVVGFLFRLLGKAIGEPLLGAKVVASMLMFLPRRHVRQGILHNGPKEILHGVPLPEGYARIQFEVVVEFERHSGVPQQTDEVRTVGEGVTQALFLRKNGEF